MLATASGVGLIDLEGRWANNEIVPLDPDPLLTSDLDPSLDNEPGSAAGSVPVGETALTRPQVRDPSPSPTITRDDDTALTAALAVKVGALKGNGDGAGTGSGGGANADDGFFRIKPETRSVVYVVDCSGSMNSPHNSVWKTRFRRLKAELLRSIGGMGPRQQFYIIFFNDHPIRMPAQTLQPALPGTKRRFLEWMAKQRAIGNTDPRGALHYALNLRPDVIYFLTDGAFAFKIRKNLLTIHQNRVAIHTFAFGSRKGEEVMKKVAAQNGGKYKFVE